MWSSLVNALKAEYNAIHIWPTATFVDMDAEVDGASRNISNGPLKIPSLGLHMTRNLRISHRTSLDGDFVTLFGWPSRGGVIVLEYATPPDFDFLGQDPLDPTLRRNAEQTAEDEFCRALLHLGATWWDSRARLDFVRRLESFDEEAHEAVEFDESLRPTYRECGWVRVAWPSHTPGSLCVLACDKTFMERTGDEKHRPRNCGLISLARTMDERFSILQRLGGTTFANIDEYHGPTFLKSWEEDHQGEKGPLVKEEFVNPSIYGGHPDDALGIFQRAAGSDEV